VPPDNASSPAGTRTSNFVAKGTRFSGTNSAALLPSQRQVPGTGGVSSMGGAFVCASVPSATTG
jgi:hypothetical protein